MVDAVFVHPLLPCQALGQALIPLPSRERGIYGLVLSLFTLTFDSSPIKGEGIWLVLALFTLTFDSSPIKGEGVMVVLALFTLTFDSSPIKGEGLYGSVGFVHPRHSATPLDCGSSPQ